MSIEGMAGVLLISPQAETLRDFYRDVLHLPLEDEIHEGMPLHYACRIGAAHFAIHSASGWPGVPTPNGQSPVILLTTSEPAAVARRLRRAGIQATGPFDHGFAIVVSFRDPDGNLIEVMQEKTGAGA